MANKKLKNNDSNENLANIVVEWLKRCEFCGKQSKQCCSTCKWAYYCCIQHQKKHWESGNKEDGMWYLGHKNKCKEPPSLFNESPLAYIFQKRYTTSTSWWALRVVMTNHFLFDSYNTQMVMIEWALRQRLLRPRNLEESTDLFNAAILNSGNGAGVSMARLLLKYNVTPDLWIPGKYLTVNKERGIVIDIIDEANTRRMYMEKQAFRLGWRPQTHCNYTKGYRIAMRTLVLIAKISL